MEHAKEHGTTFEQFAKISVKNHHHSTMNPKAMYQIETPLDDVMNAEMISYPNTKLMCSVNVDGSAAAVLVSEKKAKELGMARAVKVRASAMASDPYTDRDLVMPDVNACTRLAAKDAYDQAGIGPEDVNLVELHDCFATAEMLHYENLGLCKDGEAGKMIDEGHVELGGKVPVNVSGGLLSKGHPLGATGIANIYEICTHLRGEAGKRQVEGARIGMTHVIGLGTACGIHILEKTSQILLIGIVGDTHNNLKNISRICEIFNERKVDLVIHTGDITLPKSLVAFKVLNCKLVGVFGNNDIFEKKNLLEASKEFNCDLNDEPFFFNLKNKSICIVHHPELINEDLLDKSDFIFHGHTHRYMSLIHI